MQRFQVSVQLNLTNMGYFEPNEPDQGDVRRLRRESGFSLVLKGDLYPPNYSPLATPIPQSGLPLPLERIAGASPNDLHSAS